MKNQKKFSEHEYLTLRFNKTIHINHIICNTNLQLKNVKTIVCYRIHNTLVRFT